MQLDKEDKNCIENFCGETCRPRLHKAQKTIWQDNNVSQGDKCENRMWVN
jgi:hypothetical protein